MRILALIASDTAVSGTPALAAGDRAAVQWGVAQAPHDCHVRHPQGDVVAATFATAVGVAARVWSPEERLSAELVLIGPGAIDYWGDELAGQLAEQFGAELVCDVLSLERDGTEWRVACDAGRGAQDVVRIAGRLVAVLSADVSRPLYVSNCRRRRGVRQVDVRPDSARQRGDWQPVQPRRQRAAAAAGAPADDRANAMFGIATTPAEGRGRQVIADTPAACAQVLLRYLVHLGFVDRNVPPFAPAAPRDAGTVPRQSPAAAETMAPGPSSPSAALLRGPRRPDENEWGRARRPRLATASPLLTSAPDHVALQRRPRRIDLRTTATPRGPFRVSSGGNPSETAARQDCPLPPIS